ncbi:MAG: endonuclease [Bacteroidia bacterium]
MKKFILLSLIVLNLKIQAQTNLPTYWNFADPNISNPPNGWTLGLGTNGNLTYTGTQNSVSGGVAARLDGTGEFITIWFADKPGPLSYWLRGTGIAPNPAFTGTFSVQQSVDGNNWTTLRDFIDNMPGSMTRFVDNPSSNARYIRFFYTDKKSGSNVALDSVLIRIAPPPTTPQIRLTQGGTPYVINSTYVVGNFAQTQFSVQNTGTQQSLIITNVSFTGDAASDYAITSQLPDTIAPGQSKNLLVAFNAQQNGSRKAQLRITSNDPDNPLYSINLYGIGGSYATEPVAQPVNFSVSNLRTFAFNYSFRPAQVQPEKYIILRKIGSPVTENPADGKTYRRGDYIGNAQVAFISDTAGTFPTTYILANTNYHYAVFSFNGPNGFENYLTSGWLQGSVTTPGKNIGNYYTGVDPFNSNFIQQLTNKINPHDTVFYSLYIARVINTWLGRDTTNSRKVVTCTYTGTQHVYDDPFVWWTGTNSGLLTREHTYAQSWMPSNQGNPNWPNAPGTSQELPEYNDLHNLYPAAQVIANAVRSNNPFGNVVNATNTSPTGFGKLGTDSAGRTVYEPRPEHKGDVARALFYMCAAYHNVKGFNWSLPANQNLNVLRQWHQQDPPDAIEIARNELIFSWQKNRNPFIDFPDWANRINFSNMTYIPETTPPSIKITQPSSGDILFTNTNYGIKWNSNNVSQVNIYVSYNNQPFVTVSENVSALIDSFVWNTGNTNSLNVRIAVKDKNSNVADTTGYFNVSQPVNVINSIYNKPEVLVYPNPFDGSKIILSVNENTNAEISVMDLSGKLQYHDKRNISANQAIQLNFDNQLSKGIYIIQVQTNKGTYNSKFICR